MLAASLGCGDTFCECSDSDCTGGTGGSTTTTTTLDPGCIPNEATNPVRDDCGVFVSSSKGDDTGGDGTKAKPYATIGKALGSPESGPVYLCGEVFAEAVQIKSGATIYGALDCTGDWIYSAAKKSEIRPDAGMPALVVDPQVGVVMEDVGLYARDAAAAGGSSIAVIASTGAEVELTRCDVEAGNGKDGAVGEAFPMSAAAGAMGNNGNAACMALQTTPGGGVINACDEADPNDYSIGGSGGTGEPDVGGYGSKGWPGTTDNGGIGEYMMACTAGSDGDAGLPGTSGTGAQGSGTISAQGYTGTEGNPGESGKPGQGGGGGGAAKGGTGMNKCADMDKAGGASGASGGSGGCGGLGGNGGQAGGASIGIAHTGEAPKVNGATIVSGTAGNGGPGDGDTGNGAAGVTAKVQQF